jgi:aminoglycoside phosphotransferase (APT) family kinase protein
LTLGESRLPGDPRRTTARKVTSHVRLLKAVLPEAADELDRCAELYGEECPQALVTVHGDFHEEQVLASGGRVSGLLDVDDAGPGQLVDDLALMVARVRARGAFAQRGAERARSYASELRTAFEQVVDADELRRRTAGALLGRATAPFRGQVEDWRAKSLDRIRAAESALEDWARTTAG